MREVRRTVHAEADQVWAVLADPDTYPSWLLGAQRIRAVDPAFPEPGSGFDHTVGASDKVSVDDSSTSLEADPGRTLVLEVRARPLFRGVVRFRLVPVRDGTEVALGEEALGPLRLASPLLDPVLAARNRRSLARLQELVEARAAGSGPGRGSPAG